MGASRRYLEGKGALDAQIASDFQIQLASVLKSQRFEVAPISVAIFYTHLQGIWRRFC